ncbi:MAG: aldose 1-epimerase family protein [Treponema sp.]|jgi:hypothetical protein|nr:aldose 1-epimerase family protein [Treponema sp.]
MNTLLGMDAIELIRFAANTDQLFGVRRITIEDGKAKGSTVYEVQNGSGLFYDVLADNGLDLGRLSYHGINITWLGKPGMVSPFTFFPQENEFNNTFSGGMMFTCGLLNIGEANRDQGQLMPEHGRYHSFPASEVCAAVFGKDIVLSGKITQGQLFAHNLELRRKIISPIGVDEILIEDTLYNSSPEAAEYMLLYHCNFGYPFLDEFLELEFPESTKITPGNKQSEGKEIELRCGFIRPVDGYEERVFFHDIAGQNNRAKLRALNQKLGIGVSLEWTTDTLPHLIEWKSMRSTDYVLGLEPSTNHVIGRKRARESGTLMTIPPFGIKTMRIRFSFSTLS